MLYNLNNIIFIGFSILVIMILALVVGIQYENKKYKDAVRKLDMINSQMTFLQQQSEIQKKKIEEANKQSQIKQKENQEKLRILMKTKVPKDCNKSIQWGIEKAYEF